MDKLIYDREHYEDYCNYFGNDMDCTERMQKCKLVKTRKPHECCDCHKSIYPKSPAIYASSMYDDKFQSCYTCISCANKILKGIGCEKIPEWTLLKSQEEK